MEPFIDRRNVLLALRIPVLAAAGALLSLYIFDVDAAPGARYAAMFAGCLVGGWITAFEALYLSGSRGEWLRRSRFPIFLSLRTAVHVVIIIASARLADLIFGFGGEWTWTSPQFLWATGKATALVICFNFYFALQGLIGGRVFIGLIAGMYHHPREQQRVFLFMDVVGSTTIAERQGSITAHRLLQQIYFDIGAPILRHGGEVYQYVGDAVVVSWPMEKAIENASIVRCVFDIHDKIRSRAQAYLDTFGLVPEFRAGAHGGAIVVGQVGDWKQELLYAGDTINTAARVEQACRQVGQSFLITADLAARMVLPDDVVSIPLGGIELRGKDEKVEVVALARKTTTVG